MLFVVHRSVAQSCMPTFRTSSSAPNKSGTACMRWAGQCRQVAADYSTKRPLVVGTLTGAFVFLADLARQIEPVPEGLEVDFVRASSYLGTESSGAVALELPSSLCVAGRHVLFVEDIVDTGRTAQRLVEAASAGGAASVKLATLLDKPARRVVAFAPDYVGFECPDEFVVGLGMDYNGLYRSLPYVGVLKPSARE